MNVGSGVQFAKLTFPAVVCVGSDPDGLPFCFPFWGMVYVPIVKIAHTVCKQPKVRAQKVLLHYFATMIKFLLGLTF